VIAPQGAAPILGDKTGSREREGVLLALTSRVSQTARDDASSSLVQASPSGI
jgi:hypothetical protein